MRGGLFITLEGGEGSGKSTQIRRLKLALESKGFNVVTTREPGGAPESEKIRKLLVERDGGDWNPISECLLLFAARSMHVEKLIKPALADNKVVLCDRFTDSTRAYQGYGHQMDMATIETLNTLALGTFVPHLTFILDIPVKEGLQRALDRVENMRLAAIAKAEQAKASAKAATPKANVDKAIGKFTSDLMAKAGINTAKLKETIGVFKDSGPNTAAAAAAPVVEDRFEQLDIDFHERMRKGYLEIAAREPGRCVVVNAARPMEKITPDMLARILEF